MTDEVSERLTRVREPAVRAGVTFGNSWGRRGLKRDRERELAHAVYGLRDALLYRWQAVLFNQQLLHVIQDDGEELLRNRTAATDSREILRIVTWRQRFLFDDLVFNGVALFDYLGRYVGVLLSDNDNLKLRWDKAYKWAKHPGAGGQHGNRIHGTEAGEEVVTADQTWVRRFTEYRSEVIHYGTEKPSGSLVSHFGPGGGGIVTTTEDLEAFVPSSFVRKLKLADPATEMRILEAGELLVARIVETVEAVMTAACRDLDKRLQEWDRESAT